MAPLDTDDGTQYCRRLIWREEASPRTRVHSKQPSSKYAYLKSKNGETIMNQSDLSVPFGLMPSQPESENHCPTCKRPTAVISESAERRGRSLLFPLPSHLSESVPVTFRTKDEIVALYNTDRAPYGESQVNLSPRVKAWCIEKAEASGWSVIHFPLAYPSKTAYAGAVFVK